MIVHDVQKQLSTLILCDEKSFGQYLNRLLQSIDYPPAFVSNSVPEALRRFRHERYDLAIISSAMSEPSALETIRDIRGGKARVPRDQVIMLLHTGDFADRSDEIHLGMLGINAYLDWPNTLDALNRAVTQAISHHYLALEAIEAMDRRPGAAEQPPEAATGRADKGGKTFRLPVSALVQGLRLEEDICIHDRVLMGAGTQLSEAHLHVLEGLAQLLEGQHVQVRFGNTP